MKKLVLAALAATAFATPAFAQGNSDTTTIGADINAVCALDAPASQFVSLSGATNLSSDLYIICNDADGFSFSMTSANGYELEDAGGDSPTKYPYTLSSSLFGGPSNADIVNAPVPSNFPSAGAWVNGLSIPVTVNVGTPDGPAFAGQYRDTLTFTISAN